MYMYIVTYFLVENIHVNKKIILLITMCILAKLLCTFCENLKCPIYIFLLITHYKNLTKLYEMFQILLNM